MITFPRLIILVVLGLLLGAFASAPVEAARLTVGGTARVVTDDGTGLNLREEPSRQAERVGTANEGDTVAIIDGPFTDESGDSWYLVEAGDVTGYAIATFLVASDGEAESSRQSSGSYQYSAADV